MRICSPVHCACMLETRSRRARRSASAATAEIPASRTCIFICRIARSCKTASASPHTSRTSNAVAAVPPSPTLNTLSFKATASNRQLANSFGHGVLGQRSGSVIEVKMPRRRVEPPAPNSSTGSLNTWSPTLAPVEGQQYSSTRRLQLFCWACSPPWDWPLAVPGAEGGDLG